MIPEKQLEKMLTLGDLTRVISENNTILLNAMDEKISKNNDVLIPMMGKMMDEKISKNNDVLIPMMGKMMDEKIGKNNELIFEHFNDQTDRILNLFKGVVRVNQDGNFGMYV